MKIEFVNHSSFVVEHNGVRVLCDPWLESSVFNNGWSLIAKSKFTYEDFKNIDYIWFSHEHPDHFFPPNLKKIPAEYKKNITILFQETLDKRVVNYCNTQGYKDVVEMKPDEWIEVGDDFKLLCEHFAEGDSWMCYKGNNLTYLNTNDCGIRNKNEALEVKQKVGDVDVLLTQFSYAYWAGNPEDKEYRQQIADEKLDWLKFQADIFEPKVVIPIASYVYFSHTENFYLNDSINTPRKTFNYINDKTSAKAVVLYNGDFYTYPNEHDSETSISNYESDFDEIKRKNVYTETQEIDESELKSKAAEFIAELNENNSFYLKNILRPTSIFLQDYGKSYRLSLDGFEPVEVEEKNCDVSLTSENLQFCFLYPYGLDTTQINGRLHKPHKGNYSHFYNYFRINQVKSRGQDPNNISFIVSTAWRKLMHKTGIQQP